MTNIKLNNVLLFFCETNKKNTPPKKHGSTVSPLIGTPVVVNLHTLLLQIDRSLATTKQGECFSLSLNFWFLFVDCLFGFG